MPNAKEFVTAKIGSKKVVVFSKSYCPYCKMAKDVLKNYNLTPEEYEIIEIADRGDCSAIQKELGKITGASTVPRVFINGKCIGGGSEAKSLHASGQLKALL